MLDQEQIDALRRRTGRPLEIREVRQGDTVTPIVIVGKSTIEMLADAK